MCSGRGIVPALNPSTIRFKDKRVVTGFTLRDVRDDERPPGALVVQHTETIPFRQPGSNS